MDEIEQVEINRRLLAQAASLKIVVMALIDTHPNKELFAHHLSLLSETLTAHYLNTDVSDQFANEFQTQMAAFQSRVQSL